MGGKEGKKIEKNANGNGSAMVVNGNVNTAFRSLRSSRYSRGGGSSKPPKPAISKI
jgi:hypothetical protein